jgi:molecular chaperone DnaK (HSP70)
MVVLNTVLSAAALARDLLYIFVYGHVAGTRYIIVDCGGGTVDITVYELDSLSNMLSELHTASGGPFGSIGRLIVFAS